MKWYASYLCASRGGCIILYYENLNLIDWLVVFRKSDHAHKLKVIHTIQIFQPECDGQHGAGPGGDGARQQALLVGADIRRWKFDDGETRFCCNLSLSRNAIMMGVRLISPQFKQKCLCEEYIATPPPPDHKKKIELHPKQKTSKLCIFGHLTKTQTL